MALTAHRNDPKFATTLAHGIALLEAFDIGHAALTNKQLAERSGLSKATVSRLTSTLQARGLILFDAQTRQYRLASTALTIGYPLLASLEIRREARLGMKQLADELGGSVSMGMRDRTRMVYVETSRGHDPIAFRPDVGAALPMLQTAMGRAWLAAAPGRLRASVMSTLQEQAPELHAQYAASVRRAIDDLQGRGFCVSRGDWQADVHAIAVPLDTLIDTERLVVNCGVAARGLKNGALEAEVAPRVVELARRIEAHWRAGNPPRRSTRAASNALPQDDAPYGRTLARGLDLLLSYRPGESDLGHRDLARRLDLPGPTVVRLTHTLTELGYLRREADLARYRLGAAVLTLGYPMLATMRARQIALTAMQAFSVAVGGAVSLGFRHQTSMVYVETAWRSDRRSLAPDTGAPMPMLNTAMGRAWLCHAAPDDRQSVLNQIRVSEPEAYARFAPSVELALQEFESKGYCSSHGDYMPEVYAFAVPFSMPVDSTQFVMNCGVLATQFSFAEATRRIALPLRNLVRQVEVALGMREAE